MGWRWEITVPVPSVSFLHTDETAARISNPSMWVLSSPSIPWGSKTRWSLTQTESKPYASAFFDPSIHSPVEPYSQKWGNSKPNLILVAMDVLLSEK